MRNLKKAWVADRRGVFENKIWSCHGRVVYRDPQEVSEKNEKCVRGCFATRRRRKYQGISEIFDDSPHSYINWEILGYARQPYGTVGNRGRTTTGPSKMGRWPPVRLKAREKMEHKQNKICEPFACFLLLGQLPRQLLQLLWSLWRVCWSEAGDKSSAKIEIQTSQWDGLDMRFRPFSLGRNIWDSLP